jgi:multidrug efflux pump subunit AcrA (membrane-fusion protein)
MLVQAALAGEADRAANTVILDEAAVANLGLEFAEAEEAEFEETVFALGSIEVLPGKRAVVSSRIPGRAFSVLVVPHQQVQEGDEVAWIESRQPGDPPPTVMLPAPISGLVSKVEIAQGQPVTPDQALIEIVDLETVEAAAHVPQHLAALLQPEQRARIRLPSLPYKVLEANLAHIGVVADAASGTVEAAFHVPNPDNLLLPGLRAEFEIVVKRREGVLSVPVAAIQGDGAQKFVFIKDYELKNAFVRTPVRLGARNQSRVEILNGLFPGDEVVTRGGYPLAFAGKGTVSLKAAMDAAHGHAHNEDGSEMSAGKGDAHDHEHESDEHTHGHGSAAAWSPLTTFFAATTALLLTLLILSMVLRRSGGPA